MIIQDIYLKDYDWSIRVYYEIDAVYLHSIMNDLEALHCEDPEECLDRFLKAGLNSGLTYTSPKQNSSLVLIGKTSSPAEFQSTFDHEKGHLATHIAEVLDIDLYSEDYQYLVGEIGKQMFPAAQLFMCECGRHSIKSLLNKRDYNE